MSFSRADVTRIRDEDRELAFARLGVPRAAALAGGTEAEVYAIDGGTLLKLYAGADRIAHFETLRGLYDNLDASRTGIGLPAILDILPLGAGVAVVETRLPGVPLDDRLPALAGADLWRAQDAYLGAACALREIALRGRPPAFLLFDESGRSDAASQSFEAFYARLLRDKLDRVGAYFSAGDASFAAQAAALAEAIQTAPAAPIALIHGDFFPGNVLVDEMTHVCGVIDFGSFTMFGNALLDLAGAFGYYRMHDRERKKTRAAMLPNALDRIPAAERPQFFQFLLANAILTSDLYAPGPDPREDGHFRWAQEIVSDQAYWRQAIG